MEVIYAIMGATILWFIYEYRKGKRWKLEIDARQLMLDYEKIRSVDNRPEISTAIESEIEPRYLQEYLNWGHSANIHGFQLLGYIKYTTMDNGNQRKQIVKVMANITRETILAFAAYEINGMEYKSTELESKSNDGIYFYSTDNKFSYSFKQPETIKLNILGQSDLKTQIDSHFGFISSSSGALSPYASIDNVVETSKEQAAARLKLRQSLELPILEEEILALVPNANQKRVKELLQEMKRIKASLC